MAKNIKVAIENIHNREREDDEHDDYYEDDLPRHDYGDEGEVLFFDD